MLYSEETGNVSTESLAKLGQLSVPRPTSHEHLTNSISLSQLLVMFQDIKREISNRNGFSTSNSRNGTLTFAYSIASSLCCAGLVLLRRPKNILADEESTSIRYG